MGRRKVEAQSPGGTLGMISTIFEHAVRAGKIRDNPARGTRKLDLAAVWRDLALRNSLNLARLCKRRVRSKSASGNPADCFDRAEAARSAGYQENVAA